MQKVREFAALTAFLRTRRLAVVVEIGTLHGGTLWAWCRLADSDALVVSIDLPGGAFGGGYDESDANRLRSYARAGQRVVLLRDDSHANSTVASLERILDGRRIDLLFIDGDHSYAGVKSDFEMYRHFVGEEGLVVFHDILPHPGVPECEVHVLWEQLRTAYDHLELIDHRELRSFGEWGGLGVIFGGARTESGTLSETRSHGTGR